jgi:hypothetical protein
MNTPTPAMSDTNQQKCSYQIFGSYRYRPCVRNGVIEREGKLYCRQHDPVAKNEAQERRRVKYQAELDEQMKKHRLIVAAPALLEALEEMVLHNGGVAVMPTIQARAQNAALAKARAAIDKAKGTP